MKLERWLQLNKMSLGVFAKKIGKDRSLVHKYLYEEVIPKRNVIQAIYYVTLGAVSANDFYHLSDQLFDKNFNPNNSENSVLNKDSFS